MSELKTLKDLFPDFTVEQVRQLGKTGMMIFQEKLKADLKQEAIKDIKSLMELKKTSLDKWWEEMTGHRLTYSEEAKQGIINYIKWKFNITEEDLK